ncbi:MAG: aspartate carbamoyltransferase catalytic subunit [Clostridia bacterium]|nr:aspartate carbamoyltransferase catalytic subunit [Clostridia bacterium]
MQFKRKHLLGLKDVSKEEIETILDNASLMKHILNQNSKKTPHLQGKSIITLFYENSTRTRMSFEMAAKYMSASAANISASASSVAKGETLVDTGKNLDMMGCDLIIMRHPMSGAPHLLSKHTKASIINAGDGMNEHPTQALLDMYSIREAKGGISGLKVTIVGDIFHSRVARSNAWGLNTMGAKVTVCGPSTLIPPEMEKMGVRVTTDIREAVKGADVVMALRIQKERQHSGYYPSLREYSQIFGLNKEVISLAKKSAIIMHPGPINRGVEMTSDVADCGRSVILEQVQNGVAVRMALLYLMTRRGIDENIN